MYLSIRSNLFMKSKHGFKLDEAAPGMAVLKAKC